MPYQNFKPPALLQEYVKCFWYAERELIAPDYSFKILPDSYIEIVFCFGEQPICFLKAEKEEILPRVFILGLLNEPFTVKSNGWIHAIGIRFYAWGFYELIQMPLNKQLFQLEDQFNNMEKQLRALVSQKNLQAAVSILESFLLEQLEKNTGANTDKRIAGFAKKIYKNKGTVAVRSLAKDLYLSERQLNRLVTKNLGISPKSLARNIRFQHVRDAIYENPGINLTGLAYDFEYNDQAHLINDFKEFAGKTPGAFAKEMKELRESLAKYNVRFLQ